MASDGPERCWVRQLGPRAMQSGCSQLTLTDSTGPLSLHTSPTGPKDDGDRFSSPLMASRGSGQASSGPSHPARTTQQDLAAPPSSPSLTGLVLPPSRTLPLVPRMMVTGPRALSWPLGAVARPPLDPPIQLVLPSRTLQPLPALSC